MTLDDLVAALRGLEPPAGGATKATSVRLPVSVHRAVTMATELGMDASFTAATTEALVERLRGFVRRQAIAGHLREFPEDQPSLADVVRRRVSGTEHPAAHQETVVAEVARWYERRRPDWASSGTVDEAVDEVLDRVEMMTDLRAATGAGV